MLLKAIDGGIIDIKHEEVYTEICPTCEFGSCYINDLFIIATTMTIHIQIEQMYGYALSISDGIKMMVALSKCIGEMHEGDLLQWFQNYLNSERVKKWGEGYQLIIKKVEKRGV